jgi:predicted transposase/invertase (TIGR01784 family)
MVKGIEKGIEKGRAERNIEAALKGIVKGLDDEMIADLTGLSLAKIHALRKAFSASNGS